MVVGKRRPAKLPQGESGTLHLNPGAGAAPRGWGSVAVCRDHPGGEVCGQGWV